MTLDNVWTPPVEIDPTNNPELTTEIVNEQIFQNLLFLNSTQPFTVVSDWDIVNMNVYQNMVTKHWRITCTTGQLLVMAHRNPGGTTFGRTVIANGYFSIDGGSFLQFTSLGNNEFNEVTYWKNNDTPVTKVMPFEINSVIDFEFRYSISGNNNNNISTIYNNHVIPTRIWARNI